MADNHKLFKYGDVVRVKVPGRKAFVGKVYSTGKDGRYWFIYVEHADGLGVRYPPKYIKHVKK